MARKPSKLTVAYTPAALAALAEIWDWNEAQYSREHARRYVGLLKAETDKLETSYSRGRVIPNRPELRFITIRRRRKSYGHVAIYEIIDGVVQVLDYFHSAQDWRNKLPGEA